MANKNVMGVYLKWQKRTQYILMQKENGIMDIEVKAPIPAPDKHTSLHGIGDLHDDASFWSNVSVAAYYGINSIKGVKSDDEPW
ncbi:hypothetical protein FACS189491_06290 [Spirochaetia bacterium]|nr:hypothetical protein FACS189491_06290 [Spirochaetia bacterium]